MPPGPLTGLTSAEAAARAARGLGNRVKRSDAAEYADIVLRNCLTLFNALVVPSAIALLVLEEYRDGIAVSALAIINTAMGLAQEVRAKRHLDRLAILTEAKAHVVRDGSPREVLAGDVVQGDTVLLSAGEPVVADGTVLEARFLEVDEALLTGESDPVPRKAGDRLLSGSYAVTGEGAYVAEGVGMASFAQRTAAEARSYRFTASPLQQSVNRIVAILTGVAVFLCTLYVVLYFRQPYPTAEMVQRVAATITSMVPQGLVLMATLAFILGAVRMSDRGAVVQRLNAVESMAAVDVLCTDKTGTLTTNRLRLDRLVVLAPGESEEAVRRRLAWFASASLDRTSKSVAALRAALGEAPAELLDQLPFKSQNRYSAVRVRAGGAEHTLVLGAFEALEPFIDANGDSPLRATWKDLSQTGLRLLVFAEAVSGRDRFDGTLDGFRLRPLALVALSDELRPEAVDVLEHLATQGIAFKIISGDNPETVRATVRPLGERSHVPALVALAEQPVVTGAELEAAADPAALAEARGVFGRVAPRQKVLIVRALQARGRYVAMIGDGVNDVLPVKHAQLGIAMGEGSRATRSAADLVLETNDFGLLPETLEEGRTILRNLRRSAKLFLTKNVYTLVLVVGALGVLGLPFPFLPRQVTLLNLVTIGIPALVITLSRERSGAPARPGFLREVGGFALRTGAVLGIAGLVALFVSARLWGDDVATQRTVLLSTLVLLGVTTLLRALTDGEAAPLAGDRRFRWLAAAVVPAYLLAMYWPPSARFHELTPLDLGRWTGVLAVAAVGWAGVRLADLWCRRH